MGTIFDDFRQYENDESERRKLEEKLKSILRNEAMQIKQLNAAIMKQFAELNASVIMHSQYFEKGNYTPTQVQSLTLKIDQFRATFSRMAKAAGAIPNDKSMISLKDYCLRMVEGLGALKIAINSNSINFGAGYARKIKSAEDIFDELNKILKEARKALSSTQREKYRFVWHEFEEVGRAA